MEPRHESWFTDELREVLAHHRAALCLADRRGPLTPQWRTADWTYLRFHGGRASPKPCYSERALESWAGRLGQEWGTNLDAYAFFNNDLRGCALRDAASFGRSLESAGVAVSRVPDVPDDVLDGPRAG